MREARKNNVQKRTIPSFIIITRWLNQAILKIQTMQT